MGNLYTQIVKRKDDHRISLLVELKQQLRSWPRDNKRVYEIREELEKFHNPPKIKFPNYTKKYGIFAWRASNNKLS